jgi:hypothetical protein
VKTRIPIRWAVQWRSENRLDGKCERFMWNGVVPYLFRTRREALAFVREKYGDIATRADLRAEPHGWRMPRPVRVEVVLREAKDAS